MSAEKQIYKNVMELLVDEEVDFQLKQNKAIRQPELINRIEVATFALNRLPSLYASSREGIKKQKTRALVKYKKQIHEAVSQGFAAVEKDPLRRSTPLPQEKNDIISDAKKTMTELEDSFPKEELAVIVEFMESFLTKVQDKEIESSEIIKLYYLLDFYWEEDGNGLMASPKGVAWYG
ncbi:MAG: late competence development ComFB family protein [Cyanobacterium sp. T60_A2020_053]|nr:late competence development ComFB family protein [Cyanobacterium sp. T60_A2020_053]